MKAATILACGALLTFVHTPKSAAAEMTATSTITQLKVVVKDSPKHRLYHGALWLDHDKQTYNYRWGGEHCGGSSLTELQVSMLFAAMRSKYNVNIDYTKRLYKGNRYRCVVGFTVRRS